MAWWLLASVSRQYWPSRAARGTFALVAGVAVCVATARMRVPANS